MKGNNYFLRVSRWLNTALFSAMTLHSGSKGALIASCILTAGCDRLLADQSFPFSPPKIQHELVQYKTLGPESGDELRTVQMEIQQPAPPGTSLDLLQVTVTMTDEKAIAVFESIFRTVPEFSWIEMSREKKSLSGTTIISEHINNPPTNYFPKDSYPLFSIDYVLRGLMKDEQGPSQITTVVPGGILLNFGIRRKGLEEIEVPAGRFMCRKITLAPKIDTLLDLKIPFFNTLSRPFMPKASFWFDVNPPYLLVKKASVAGIPPNDEKIVDRLEKILFNGKTVSADPQETD